MTEQLWPGTPLPSVAADEVFSSEKKRNAHNITVRRCTCTYLQNTHTCTRTRTTKHTHTHTCADYTHTLLEVTRLDAGMGLLVAKPLLLFLTERGLGPFGLFLLPFLCAAVASVQGGNSYLHVCAYGAEETMHVGRGRVERYSIGNTQIASIPFFFLFFFSPFINQNICVCILFSAPHTYVRTYVHARISMSHHLISSFKAAEPGIFQCLCDAILLKNHSLY